jgi:hypothetical protein
MTASKIASSAANDVLGQARSGSITAIIQILNDRLAEAGVRTRAVLEGAVLQLLCEAPSPEQLNQASLAPHVQRILEGISPRNIRKVKLYGRIIREQQLLWLEEINRDPEGHLLWSQQLVLKQPSFLKRWLDDRQQDRLVASQTVEFPALGNEQSKRPPVRKLRVGALGGLGLVALGGGFFLGDRLGWWPSSLPDEISVNALKSSALGSNPGQVMPRSAVPGPTVSEPTAAESMAAGLTAAESMAAGLTTPGSTTPGSVAAGLATPGSVAPSSTTLGSTTPGSMTPGSTTPGSTTPGSTTPGLVAAGLAIPEAPSNGGAEIENPLTAKAISANAASQTGASDPFTLAVRMAQQASQDGLQAKSSAEWLDLAARWQKASDLMAEIPKVDARYAIASDRVSTYRNNSEAALEQAGKS